MDNHKKIEHLFLLYLNNQCSPEEVNLLASYFNQDENEKHLKNLIQKELQTTATDPANPDVQDKLDEIFKNIKKSIQDSENQST